jgi:hypothetical protein
MSKPGTRGFISISLFFILSFFPDALFAGNEKDKTTENIFFLIYNQHFGEAENKLVQSKPVLTHLNYMILEIDLRWWKAISSDAKVDFELLEKKLSTYSKESEGLSGPARLEELVCLNYQFRLATFRSQPLKMIHYFLKINHFVEQTEFSSLPLEGRDLFSLYKAIFSYGKSKIFFLSPNIRSESLAILKNYAGSSDLVNQTIANYFLARIYIETEKSPILAKPYYEWLFKMYPDNKIFRKYFLSGEK